MAEYCVWPPGYLGAISSAAFQVARSNRHLRLKRFEINTLTLVAVAAALASAVGHPEHCMGRTKRAIKALVVLASSSPKRCSPIKGYGGQICRALP